VFVRAVHDGHPIEEFVRIYRHLSITNQDAVDYADTILLIIGTLALRTFSQVIDSAKPLFQDEINEFLVAARDDGFHFVSGRFLDSKGDAVSVGRLWDLSSPRPSSSTPIPTPTAVPTPARVQVPAAVPKPPQTVSKLSTAHLPSSAEREPSNKGKRSILSDPVFWTILIASLGVIATVATPELRRLVGLDKPKPAATSSPQSQTEQSVPSLPLGGTNTQQPTVINVPAPIITLPPQAPPPKARLQFSFWPIGSDEHLVDNVSKPLVDGVVTVAFTAKEVGAVQADNGQLWIQLCDGCKFAEEPVGTTAPPDDATVRRKRFDTLHMGSYFEATTLKIIPPSGLSSFTIALKYSCERCPPIDNSHPQKLRVDISPS
jgi:hypothetical protein